MVDRSLASISSLPSPEGAHGACPDGLVGLDIEVAEQLTEWLRISGRIGPNERIEMRPLAGGVSNRTVLVRRPNGEAWVLKQALAKLRVAADWFCDPARVHREALGMQWLATLAPSGTIPRLLFEDTREHVVAMGAVRTPHDNWKTLLLRGEVQGDHVRRFAQLIAAIHRHAFLASSSLKGVFDDRSYFEQLRLEPFYEFTASQVPSAARFLRSLAQETRECRFSLVHGDFSPKNILIQRDRLILIDHEVIHWGDPMFDIGFAVAHLLCKAHHLQAAREALGGAALYFWSMYEFATCHCLAGAEHQARAVRHALGCLLARVAGRSPVEYLSPAARHRQKEVAAMLMEQPPDTVSSLTERFLSNIG